MRARTTIAALVATVVAAGAALAGAAPADATSTDPAHRPGGPSGRLSVACVPEKPYAVGAGLGYTVVAVRGCPDPAVDGYRILAYRRGVSAPVRSVLVGPDQPQGRVDGLEGGLVHRFRVAAVVDGTDGTPGPASDVVIPPFTSVAAFTHRQHIDFAGRPATPAERADWEARLVGGTLTAPDAIAALEAGPHWRLREQIARLYLAAYGRVPDRAGLAFWTDLARGGASLHRIGDGFMRSGELVARDGDLTDAELVDLLYRNTLGRPADPAGSAYWTDQLESGARTRGAVLVGFSESSEHRARSGPTIGVVSTFDGMLRRMPETGEVNHWKGSPRTTLIAHVLRSDPTYHPYVVAVAPPVITTRALPAGVVESEYRAAVAVEEGSLPLTVSLASGALPAGLSLSPAGVVSGIPTAVGSATATIRVTDRAGRTHSRSFTVAVGHRLAGAVAVSAATRHACAALLDGSVRCWGGNLGGQLGAEVDEWAPTSVAVPGVDDAVDVAAGERHTCALIDDGTVTCWGTGAVGRPPTDGGQPPTAVPGVTGATALDSGPLHTCAVVTAGAVQCWGRNSQGQLGDGTTTDRPAPVTVVGLVGAVDVAVGDLFTCARLADGTARCWGQGDAGQLGGGSTASSSLPTVVLGLAGITDIAAGGQHACATLGDGTARCWGRGGSGQLGTGGTGGQSVPTAVAGLTGAIAVGGGSFHTCAAVSDGSTRCWGSNTNRQLGDGTTTDRPAPATVAGVTWPVDVDLGERTSCAIVGQGWVRCWGEGAYGRLGGGDVLDGYGPSYVGA